MTLKIWKAWDFDQRFSYCCQWECVELWWNEYQTAWSKLTIGPLDVEYLGMANNCCALKEMLSFSAPIRQ